MTEIANKELKKTTVDEKAVSETAAGGIKIDKDGSIVLPTASVEWDAAVERSKAQKIENELEDTSSIEPEKPVSEYPYDEKEVLEDVDELTVEQVTALWGEMRKLQRNITATALPYFGK